MRIRGWFIMGLLAHTHGAVWVHGDGDRGTATIIRLSRLLERGESLMIFRLGGLPMVRDEREYQVGTVLIAQRAGVPIVPARVDGVLEVLRRFGKLGPKADMVVRTAPHLWWARTTTPLRYSFDCAALALRQRP